MTELSFDIASLHDFYAVGGSPEHVIALAHERLAAADDSGIFLHLVPAAQARPARAQAGTHVMQRLARAQACTQVIVNGGNM